MHRLLHCTNLFIPLFLLTKKAQKKKLGKKKYAVKGVSSSAEDDQGFAFGNHKLFEKSLTKTFSEGVCASFKVLQNFFANSVRSSLVKNPYSKELL